MNIINAFDIFKIGIGLPSSHAVEPMGADKSFVDLSVSSGELPRATYIVVDLYRSFSLAGKGHMADVTIIMRLTSNSPQNVDIGSTAGFTQEAAHTGRLSVAEGTRTVDLSPDKNTLFHAETLPRHESGIHITVWDDTETLLGRTYYSVGGDFIVEEEQLDQAHDVEAHMPYNFHSASELLRLCEHNGLSVSGLMTQSELAMRSKGEVDADFAAIWDAIHAGIKRSMNAEGVLPGPLNVPHRVVALRRLLVSSNNLSSDPMNVIGWINMFALAVSEENIAGYRVVTIPANGIRGIISAVLTCYDKFRRPANANPITRYSLAARTMGVLYKMNASISGAEVGCQGETGVACLMVVVGLTELLGDSPSQVCIAAGIAMECNLGLACDSVAGRVQIPCTERNAISAVKTVNVARMAPCHTSEPHVSLDKVIETMYETGKDMGDKCREASRGGLAIRVVCT